VSFYVVVRGPLGAGKTAVSRGIASAVRGTHVLIDTILDDYRLEEWDEVYISERSFLRANEIAVRQSADLLRGGTPVVFDGNFYYRSVVEDLLFRLDFPHLVVTLKAPLATCVARDAQRLPSLGAEAAREVYAISTSFDYGTLIDATRPLDEVVLSVLAELRRVGLIGERPGAA